eukprot:10256-Heterococcus_DN1.PRE.2
MHAQLSTVNASVVNSERVDGTVNSAVVQAGFDVLSHTKVHAQNMVQHAYGVYIVSQTSNIVHTSSTKLTRLPCLHQYTQVVSSSATIVALSASRVKIDMHMVAASAAVDLCDGAQLAVNHQLLCAHDTCSYLTSKCVHRASNSEHYRTASWR